MNKAVILIAAAAVFGTGYIVGKKLVEKNPQAVATIKDNCTDTFHKASVYCAGAVKTGSKKLADSVSKIAATSKEKGEELLKKAAETKDGFKNEIKELKNMVVSINENDKAEPEKTEKPDSFVFTEDGADEEITELPEENSEAL